jgi:hypothetical protein
MIEVIHLDADETMLKENIVIHDINKACHSFQFFSVNVLLHQIIQ